MDSGFRELKLTWPLFRAWWSGLWFGVTIGIYAGLWLSQSRWIEMPFRLLWWAIPGSCVFIAFLPRTVFQISQGISRYRAAARGEGRAA